ncbi:hypothetical protein JKF63_01229 [Porcisia hertigi]|uniref:non-specific serine/threonine protein kinase n=1 Tax=Porcisia hertigi TaxID=2761500 RepID=A0A836L351_9TRYP|nr:hypothetical protein JKF63_01229 [Porcisia hertigi]
MSTKRGGAGDHAHMASPAKSKDENPFFTHDATAFTVSRESETGGVGFNPLIDDLKDLRPTSFRGNIQNASHLQEQSISRRTSDVGMPKVLLPLSEETTMACFNPTRAQQCKVAVDILCKTSQQFVHTMQIHNVDDFFFPLEGESAEDALRRQLGNKDRHEMEKFVLALVELLEDIRKVRGQAGPLVGSFSLQDGTKSYCCSSSSTHSTVSTASLVRSPVQETHRVTMTYDQYGHRMINRYRVIADLGRGAYGKVKLGADVSTEKMVAIKIINKKHLKRISGFGFKDQDEVLKREIAIMKKVRHRNCVSLYEVIDDPDSQRLYLIMEYVPNGPVVRLKPQQLNRAALEAIEAGFPLNGDVFSKVLMRCAVRRSPKGEMTRLTESELTSNPTVFLCKPLSQHICALYLRQLVSGLRYMHKRCLVHHDIKPENILLGTGHHVFLSDFGVSEIVSTLEEVKQAARKSFEKISESASDEAPCVSGESDLSSVGGKDGSTEGTARLGAGTLLFTAPELFGSSVHQHFVDPYLTDVWALGVTLYCMLVGMSPFFGSSYSQVRTSILTQAFPWSGKTVHEAPLAAEWLVVLNGLLAKDPSQRWSLFRLKSYLDKDDFQSVVQKSALCEASLGAGSSISVGGKASISIPQSPGLVISSATATSTSVARPSFAFVSMANGLNSSFTPSCMLSSSSPFSALAIDTGVAARNLVWDMGVSEQEVRDATRTVRVEVTRQRTILSAHTRCIVHRYVESVRASMRKRHFIQLGSSSHFGSSSQWGFPVPAHVLVTSRKKSNAPTSGGDAVYMAHVPQLSEAKIKPTTESGPISATSLFYPKRRSSQPKVRASDSGNRWDDRCQDGSGGLAKRILTCNSESLDAVLSIVNLQSLSQESFFPLSLTSSSISSVDSCAHMTNVGNRTARFTKSQCNALTAKLAPPSKYMRIPRGGSVVRSHQETPLGISQGMTLGGKPPLVPEEDRPQQVGSLENNGPRHEAPRYRKLSSHTMLTAKAAHCPATLTCKRPCAVSSRRNSPLYKTNGGLADSSLLGCRSTSLEPKNISFPKGFLALPSDRLISAKRPQEESMKDDPVEPGQQRLCGGKRTSSALSCTDEVQHTSSLKTAQPPSSQTTSSSVVHNEDVGGKKKGSTKKKFRDERKVALPKS